MCEILAVSLEMNTCDDRSNLSLSQFEADRRAFMITINSFDTGLTQDERAKLYPACGHLYPDGLQELRRTDSYDAVRDVAARYPVNPLP